MEKPFFSIVTVCYNSEKTIRRTLESIRNQTFSNYEYVIIDGKSKDKTLDIVNEYMDFFRNKLHCISEPDKGIYDAFSKGVRHANGKYVWIVNSDDFLEENALQLVYEYIKGRGNFPDVICGKIEYFNPETNEKHIFGYTKEIGNREFHKKRMGICHPATVVKNEVYENIGVFDDRFRIMGDVDWFLRLRENGYEIDYLDLKLSNMQGGGVSGQVDTGKRLNDWKILYKKHTSNWLQYAWFMLYRIVTYYKHGRKE